MGTENFSIVPRNALTLDYEKVTEDRRETAGHLTVTILDVGVYINKLYVHKEHRRQGIGTKLMEQALRMFAGQTILLIPEPWADCSVGFRELYDWYARLGFVDVTDKYADGRCIMELNG